MLRITLILFVCALVPGFSQSNNFEGFSTDTVKTAREENNYPDVRQKNSNWTMDVPVANVLPTHPAGIFYSRIRPEYRTEPLNSPLLRINLSSANTWLQPVEGYRPLDESKRNELAKLEWYQRQTAFNREENDAKTIFFSADGVIRSLLASYTLSFKKNQELNINFKAYLVTGGKFPLTFLTSDDLIEWFHSNIAGGEDVFGRKYFDYDEAHVLFRDEKNRTLEFEKGDVLFPGIQFNYSFLIPVFEKDKEKLDVRLTPMMGINFSKAIQGIDVGFTGTGVYKNLLSSKFSLHSGLSLILWAPEVLSGKDQVSVINKKFIPGIEGFLAFNLHRKDGKTRTLGMSYSIRDSYRKRSDYDVMVLYGQWQTSAQWHHSIGHWYKTRIKMNYYFTFSGKTQLTLYLQEDYPPNNAPDLQTGVEWVIPLNLIINRQ